MPPGGFADHSVRRQFVCDLHRFALQLIDLLRCQAKRSGNCLSVVAMLRVHFAKFMIVSPLACSGIEAQGVTTIPLRQAACDLLASTDGALLHAVVRHQHSLARINREVGTPTRAFAAVVTRFGPAAANLMHLQPFPPIIVQ
jgi:hypothetical protein